MRLAFVFPGQGAQYVGMGRSLYQQYETARAVFAEADQTLGFSLSELCFAGPEDQLKLTYHTQPALLTVSTAAHRVFAEQTGLDPLVVAGHSLGEYSAVVAAGGLPFAQAVSLVYRRGRWMEEAVPSGQGTMAAVLGLDGEALAAVCRNASTGGELVQVANLNCPGQVVISGHTGAVARASELAKAAGARRVIPLEVSGPFHCELMRPAADQLTTALQSASFVNTRVPVVANVDAQARTAAAAIRQALIDQLVQPVRWEEDVRAMLALGAEAFVEFGPGTVLSGLIKKIDRRIPTFHVEDESSLRETIQALQG
ncbi:MAG: ACP S-malonyltransferase [Alicyclobacillus sp.]|nr:ACP S-malonyltransferase [Alicyclobacillus sp.]